MATSASPVAVKPAPKERHGWKDIGKLPGKRLICDQNGSTWRTESFVEVAKELNATSSGPRIISVQTSADRKARLEKHVGIAADPNDRESLEWFCEDSVCRDYMTGQLHFPDYLLEESWCKCNGFAGSKRLDTEKIKISWFRILVKWVTGLGERDYRWHEMTFFIHEPDNEEVTVLMFDVPDHEEKDSSTSHGQSNGNTVSTNPEKSHKKQPFRPKVNSYNFVTELCEELDRCSQSRRKIDWKFMQAVLLKQSITVVDRAVWACSKTVRELEKTRPDPKNINSGANFNFPDAHNLLRHAIHLAETLGVASDTLRVWLDHFEKSERRIRRKANPGQPNDDDSDFPADMYHDSLLQSLQLLKNLQARSTSNEARLRNEIGLAFNLVSQTDQRAMRIISLVTLLFLPATFVSTLFSMSFFNYQTPGEPKTEWSVTYKIWIYAAVAVPLTILGILLWTFGEKWMAMLTRMTGKKDEKTN